MSKDKRSWPPPAAWAITQNERKWEEFDPVADRAVIVSWSLADNYRTRMMRPGDRTLFWITGKNGGLARLGFVLEVWPSPGEYWEDASGTRHDSPFGGRFFLPPFPNRRYIHRSAFAGLAAMRDCELLGTVAQLQPPLRVEAKEWKAIEKQLIRFDRSNRYQRSPWPD